MKQPNITIYGSATCPDTVRTRRFLDEHKIEYEYKDVDENPDYNGYIAGLNSGKRVLPTIRIDNDAYFNPELSELEEAVVRSVSDRD